MHKEAQLEATRLAYEKDGGGVRQAFACCVVVQRKALIGLLYWLAKVAHTTKFNLKKLLFCLSVIICMC